MVVSRWRVFALETFPSRVLAFLFPSSSSSLFHPPSHPYFSFPDLLWIPPFPFLHTRSSHPPFFLLAPTNRPTDQPTDQLLFPFTHRFGNDRRCFPLFPLPLYLAFIFLLFYCAANRTSRRAQRQWSKSKRGESRLVVRHRGIEEREGRRDSFSWFQHWRATLVSGTEERGTDIGAFDGR